MSIFLQIYIWETNYSVGCVLNFVRPIDLAILSIWPHKVVSRTKMAVIEIQSMTLKKLDIESGHNSRITWRCIC